jgi:hypothetical protein
MPFNCETEEEDCEAAALASSISPKFLRFFGFSTEKPKSEHLRNEKVLNARMFMFTACWEHEHVDVLSYDMIYE